MKKLITILFIIFATQSFAITYYISNAGSDANNGTSTSTPWQTLVKVNATTFSMGDSILFKRGESFYGNLIESHTGSLIIYGSYGVGNRPIITGFTTISGWTNIGSNIWESTSPVSTLATCNMVVINGQNTQMGRYPNTGYLTYQSYSGTTSITSSSLSGTPNWSGAEVVIRVNDYVLDRTNISSQSSGTLTYSPTATATLTNNFGFFIQNDSRTLDSLNEWYYNPSTKKLQIYSIGSPVNVQVPTIDTLVKMIGNTVTFDNIDFIGSNSYGFYNNVSGMWDVTIQNCSINFSGIDGIKFENSTRFTLDKSTVSNSNNNAVGLITYNPTTVIKNSTIQNTGVYAGMGRNGFGSYDAILFNGDNSLVKNNIILNTGFNPVVFYGTTVSVLNNFISSFCSVKQDGAGIYIGGNGRTITGNIIGNGIGAANGTNDPNRHAHGIYLDDDSYNISVLNNTAFNCSSGLYIHNAYSFSVENNLFYNNEIQFATGHDGSKSAITGAVITNNKFISKMSNQLVGYFYSASEDISSWGTVDSNYYARPMEDNLIFARDNGGGITNYSLAGWQTYSGFDIHSNKSPKTISDTSALRFYYNSDTTSKVIALDAKYIDVTGANYNSGSITLQPFTSAVLINNGALTTYYVSNSGSDAALGTSSSTPWQTIDKVNAANLNPGDHVLFKRGDSFYGSLSIQYSGTNINPITFGAYGTGAKPIITGFTNVTAWTNLGGNIWESTSAVSPLDSTGIVTINGVNTPMGRFPNTGFLTMKSYTSNNRIIDTDLTGTPNWTGAEAAYFVTSYEVNRAPITSQSGDTLTITPPNTISIQYVGLRYIIQNDPRTLDAQNEWYYNPSTKKLRIYSTTSPTNVKISTIESLVTNTGGGDASQKHYININNISFTGASLYGIELKWIDYTTIDSCDFNFMGTDAIRGHYGYNIALKEGLVISNSTFNNVNSNAISIEAAYIRAVVTGNTVSNVGTIMGANESGPHTGIGIYNEGHGSITSYNTVTNTGYNGIQYGYDSSIVNNNIISDALSLRNDGGAIYTTNGARDIYGGPKYYGRKVYSNIILNSPNAEGIYSDDGNSGIEIYGNTIAGCNFGLYLHGTLDMNVHDNLVYNNAYSQFVMTSEIYESLSNNNIHDNIFVSKDISERVYYVHTVANDLLTFGTSDNNIISRPQNDTSAIYAGNPTIGDNYFTLAQWQAYSGQDLNSTASPKIVTDTSDFRFEYNTSPTATIGISGDNPLQKYLTMDSTSVMQSDIHLAPFQSILLIRNGLATPTIDPGSSIWISRRKRVFL